METDDQDWVAGADGYRDGWAVVLWQSSTGAVRHRTVASVADLLDLPESPSVIGLDMVVGLPDVAKSGGRACDRMARSLLGFPRSSSVFSPPVYAALNAETHAEATALNKASGPDAPGLTIQAFHLLPKMREVASHMTPERQQSGPGRVVEVHPEMAFYAMNGDASVDAKKKTPEGRAERVALLEAHGFSGVETAVDEWAGGTLKPDDILDAYAACWSAGRIRDGEAERLPSLSEPAPTNARGLRMEIWR